MPVDWVALSGMIFTLLLALVIGGFILMFPLSRRLGELMEQQLKDRREGAVGPGAEVMEGLEDVRAAVRALEAQVVRMADRQAFLERLLEGGPRRGELQAGEGDRQGHQGEVP